VAMVWRDGMPDQVVDEVVEARDAPPPGGEAEGTDVAGEFARQRESLFAVAYRILGTRTDAEDVVQEAWLRWSRVDPGAVEDPRGYLFRLVTNQAIDQLRRVRARRESYVGPWLPEPLLTAFEVSGRAGADGGPDVGRQVELAESVSMGLLVVLETLAPVEGAVFVLHEAFGFGYTYRRDRRHPRPNRAGRTATGLPRPSARAGAATAAASDGGSATGGHRTFPGRGRRR
jgi:DNA-directed RNA polymerase specialized sigma24 family protein